MHKETIKRELWRTIKLLLLIWLLDGVFTVLGGGVLVFQDLVAGMSREAIEEHLAHSNFIVWMGAFDSLLVIAVFVYYKYVKISLGRHCDICIYFCFPTRNQFTVADYLRTWYYLGLALLAYKEYPAWYNYTYSKQ